MALVPPLLNGNLTFAQASPQLSSKEELQQSILALEQIIGAYTERHKEEQGLIDGAVNRALGKDSFKHVRRFVYDPNGDFVKQLYLSIYGRSLEGYNLQKFEGTSAITLPIQTESGTKSYVFFKESALPGGLNDKDKREIAYHKLLGKVAHENTHAGIYSGGVKVQGEYASGLLKTDHEVADFLQEVECNRQELMFLTKNWIRPEAFVSAVNVFEQYVQRESEKILARTDISEGDRKRFERQKAMATNYINTAIRIKNSYGRG